MKRTLLITTLILSISYCSVAQKPRFGFDAGISINRAAYQPEEGVDRRIIGGFDGGLLVEFSLSKRLKLQPELNYFITGVELNTGTSERSLKLQYVTIPLLLKVNIVKGLNLVAGPQHGILVSAWTDPSGEVSIKNKEYYKFTDVAAVVGAEYKFTNGLFFGVKYNHGMEQIVEEKMGFEMKNRSLSARVGYIF